MGKSVRKYRKNSDYDYIAPEKSNAAACHLHDSEKQPNLTLASLLGTCKQGCIILIPFCLFAHSHRKIQNFAVVSTLLLLLTSLCIVGKAKYFHDENAATAFGIGGYVSFLSDSRTDMVGNQDFSSKQGTLLFWLLVPVCAMFCIPLEVVSSRHAAMFMYRARSQRRFGQEEVLLRAQPAVRSQQYTASSTPPGSHHSSTSSAYQNKMGDHHHDEGDSSSGCTRVQIVAALLVLAILVQIVALPSSINIATLLSVTGGIAGITLLLVVPAACYLKLAPPNDDSHRPTDSWLFTKCLPWSSIGVGLAASVACVISNIVQG